MRERWNRVEELFAELVDLSPLEQADYLQRTCMDEPDVRAEVESLLASAIGAGARLREAMSATAESLVEDLSRHEVGTRIGPYRILERIGEGGMGTVYLAERGDGQYRGRVALKILQHAVASQQVVARFRDERQILATLTHPCIVRLLDGGTTDEGLPYLVMEHIAGMPLERHAETLPVRERVALLIKVCEPLEYAHQRLVVHRDIKPSNVLVTPEGQPKLLDFGIAKLLEPSAAAGREARTRTGMALLTPEYASPEQARGDVVSVASDVYSLGAVLFHVLAGRPPQVSTDDVLFTLRQICETDPPRPSTIAEQSDQKAISGDLDNITMRALQKDPALRYPSVAAFADDLQRHLDGHPVRAREATWSYRATRFVRRNRSMIALGVAVFVALSVATVVSLMQAERATASANEAQRQNRALLVEQGRQALADGDAALALPYLVSAWQRGEDTAALRFMMREAERPITRELVRIQDFPQGLWAVQVAPAPHDDRFVACGNAGRVAIHEVGGRLVHDLTVDVGRPLSFDRCTFDATAARVVAVSREGIARAWDATTGAVLWTIDRGATPVKDTWTNQAATFAVEGERVVVCRKQRSAEVWDLSTGAVLFEKAFALDTYCGLVGDRLFVGTLGTLDEYELTNTERVRNIYTSPPGDDPVYAFGSIHDAQRQRLYYVVDRRVFIWDLSTHALIASLPHASGVSTLTLSHDGRLLATAGTDGQITVWNAHTGELRREHTSPSGQRVRVEHVAFDPAGHHLIATFADNILRVYDVMTGELEVAHPVTYNAGAGPSAPAVPISSHAARGHDGTPFGRVVSHVGAEVIVWRPSRGALTQDIRPKQHTYAGVVAPDGEHLLVTGASFAEVRTSSSGEVVKALSTASEVRFWGADWSRSGVLAIAGERATAELFDAASGRSLGRLEGHEGTINSIAFSPDGLTIATAGEDRSLRVWDVATRREVARLPHDSRVMSVAWSRDGMALVSAEFAGVLRVWDVGAQAVTTTVREPALRFLSVEFTHDDQAIIGGARESVAATWDRHTGQRLVTFEGHSAQVTWVGESPDGALVATVSVDQSVRLWDAHTGVELGRRKHLTEIVEGTWHRDQVISFGNEAFVRFWDASRFEGTLVDAETLMQRTPWRLVDGRVQRLRRDP